MSALLIFSNLLGAQTPDNSGFYLDVTGHALFPHATADPTTIAGQSAGLDTGAGLTAALGYTFRGGFSAEVEWGFQQVGIGNPDENFSLSAGGFFLGIPSIRGIPSIGTVGGILDDEGSVDNFLPFSFQIDGEIQIQSLMANLSYRHPAWRRRLRGEEGRRSRLSECVATFTNQQESDWLDRPSSVSCNHIEQLVDELNLVPNVRTAHTLRPPLPDHVNCLISLDRSPDGRITPCSQIR